MNQVIILCKVEANLELTKYENSDSQKQKKARQTGISTSLNLENLYTKNSEQKKAFVVKILHRCHSLVNIQ